MLGSGYNFVLLEISNSVIFWLNFVMRFRICTYFLYLLVITYDALSASFGRRRMMSRCQIDVTMLKEDAKNFLNLCFSSFFALANIDDDLATVADDWLVVHSSESFLWLVGKTLLNWSDCQDFCLSFWNLPFFFSPGKRLPLLGLSVTGFIYWNFAKYTIFFDGR